MSMFFGTEIANQNVTVCPNNRRVSIKTWSKFLGEKRTKQGIFQTTPSFKRSSPYFLPEFLLTLSITIKFTFCCCLYHRETSTANMSVKKKLSPATSDSRPLTRCFFVQIFFFSSEEQAADKVADEPTDGWASLDWREHVTCSRAGVALYCAML